MKHLLLPLATTVVRSDLVWQAVGRLDGAMNLLKHARGSLESKRGRGARIDAAILQLVPDGRVQTGLCRGLRFPDERTTFSTVEPMLLGLYERVLQDEIERLIVTRSYDVVLNIGCADGFYAVGLKRRLPKATVIAFDILKEARIATAQMAKLNHVAIDIRGEATAENVRAAVADASHALILCDVESWEVDLFPEGSGHTYARHDLAIETHDHLPRRRFRCTPHVEHVFGATHDLKRLRAEDDIESVRRAHERVPALGAFDIDVRDGLVSENRQNVPGEWLIAVAK